jgi:hypothetical protein
LKALKDAFRKLEAKSPPPPPPEVGALTFSERRLFEKALGIYSSPPGAPELVAAFHCSRVIAAKVQTALVAYFIVPKRRRENDDPRP